MNHRWPAPMGPQPMNNFGPLPMPFYPPPHVQSGIPPPPMLWGPQSNGWQNEQRPNTWRNASPRGGSFSKKRENNKRQRKEPVYIDYCDICDRGFKNLDKKAEHFRQHIPCDEPGCSFEAHFKIVAIHKQNLHGANALKIKLETPEDIQRWRDERKRKYPSRTNVAQKMKRTLKEQELGNVLENKYFGKMQQRKTNCQQNTAASGDFREKGSSAALESAVQAPPLNLLFSGSVAMAEGTNSSDEETDKRDVSTAKAGNSFGLGSLMQSYASSSEDENVLEVADKNVSEAPKSTCPNLTPRQRKLQNGNESRDGDTTVKSSHEKYGSARNKGKNCVLNTRRPSLLEMLLAPDIRRERNHVLQCVRFIVKNNFLEIKSSD